MSRIPSKFLPVISDTGPIIALFRLGLWEKVIERYDLLLVDNVVKQAMYYEKDDGTQCPIDLRPWISAGQIRIMEVTLEQAGAFFNRFDANYIERFHDGELESLTYLTVADKACLIVSGDSIVYRTVGRLNMGDRGVSLEKMLNDIGFRKALDWCFTEKFRKIYTDKGQQDFIHGFKVG